MKKLKSKWITKDPAGRLYNLKVPVVGLTGGIATGKSTVAALLRNENLAVIDADALVKKIYQTKEAHDFVQLHFREAVNEGKIDFRHLRASVFGDPKKQELIEQFIYSKLPAEFLSAYEEFHDPSFIIYDVPLLFEKKLDRSIDTSVCVYSPKVFQLDRLMKRDHISEELAEMILSKQMDIEAKRNSSDLVIDNSKDQDYLKQQVRDLLNTLLL